VEKNSRQTISAGNRMDIQKNYLSPAPQAEPHAAGFSAGLSAAPHALPHAAGFSAGLSDAPHAAGFSLAPHAAAGACSVFRVHPNKFESAIIFYLLLIKNVFHGLAALCDCYYSTFFRICNHALFYYPVTNK
jgi:hypothetical protein